MGDRGRKSSAELAVIQPSVTRLLPPPPSDLTPEQAEIWRFVIASKSGDLIAPEAYPVLTEYCRAVTAASQIAQQLRVITEKWQTKNSDDALMPDNVLVRIDKLHAMQDRMRSAIASLSVKLRLSPSTQVHPEKAGTNQRRAGLGVQPWRFEQEKE
jgi:hypothetical protein